MKKLCVKTPPSARAVPSEREPVPRDIPQAMARAAAFRLKTELYATIASARAEHRRPDCYRLAMWARIGAAVLAFEKEMGI